MVKRIFTFIIILTAGLLLWAATPDGSVQASPTAPTRFTVTQPDGTTFTAVQWGDENINGLETVDGYAIARDESSGFWYYLTANPDGTLTPAQQDGAVLLAGIDPPTGLRQHLRPPGSGSIALASPASAGQPAVKAPSASGTQKVLVLLAGFPDATGRTSTAYWQNLIFGASGSLKHYYETVSYGAFSISPAAESSGTANDGIVGWLNLVDFYAKHPNPVGGISDVNRYITKRALELADTYVNYAAFDTDASGSLSTNELHIIVIVAGFERSYGGLDEPAVWAHNSDLKSVGAPTLDGKVLANADRGGYYTQVGEYHLDHPGTMGVIAHEFGHDLAWPSLFDTDYSSYGVGRWSLMGTGFWNGITKPGDSPAFPGAWEKWYQGWLTPTTISGYSYGQSIPQAETNQTAFLLRPNPLAIDWTYRISSGDGEYFLVENRQLTSYDAALPGCGLLVWHIDESVYYDNYANANENRPLVKLIQADGLDELRYKVDQGDAGDPYPGSTVKRSLTYHTVPNSRLYNGSESFVRVSAVSNCAATMSADLLYGYPVPTLTSLIPPYSGPSTNAFSLTINGIDFFPASIVRWNGSDRTTYYVSGTKLQADITAADMAALGGPGNSASVTVFNPQPGGGESDPLSYDIVDPASIIPRAYFPVIFHDYKAENWPGYIIEMHQEFESTFPAYKWEITEAGTDDYRWGRRDCRFFNGLSSAWAAGGGANGGLLSCGSTYPGNLDTSMTYGPFSTEEGILNGEMVFKVFMNSEVDHDFLWVTAGPGGSSEYGFKMSGNSSGWITKTLNLNDLDGAGHSVIGYPNVWIRFRFTSDYLGHIGEGAFIDDILLRLCKTEQCNPNLSPLMKTGDDGEISPDDLIVVPVEYIPGQ
ncbi:MAG: M6 family metalloprotease domain-containing protein [Anaerolineaceae bacterium]|nr:M6 family metalloprotease domain-containing protein [Anaerolineaceae bacterium]